MQVLLASIGVLKEDRVVAQVEKSIGAVMIYLACLRSGVIHVPFNTAYKSNEVDYFLDRHDYLKPLWWRARGRHGGLCLARWL